MRSFLPALLTAALLVLAGCETVVDVDLPEHEPRLVVNDIFVAGQPWSVSVTRSAGIQEVRERANPSVENATVELLAGSEVIDTLVYADPEDEGYRSRAYSYYSPAGHVPRAERRYTLRVSAPGFQSVTATGRAPAPVPFRVSQGEDRPRRDFDVTVTDPAGRDDSYALVLYEKGAGEDGQTAYYGPRYFSSSSPLLQNSVGVDIGDGGQAGYERGLFTDDIFQGETRTLTIRPRGYFDPQRPRDDTSPEPIAVLASLSEAAYEYLRTAELAGDTEGNPFAEPVQVYSNIDGGLGIFAGAAWTERTLPVEEPCPGICQQGQ